MAKSPIVKFPRITAGFYSITYDGELVGYISKKVEDKETTWSIYNTSEPDLTLETLPVSALVEETELFREAKENAKVFFANRPKVEEEVKSESEFQTVELQKPDWSEDEITDFFDEVNEYEEVEAELVGV